MNISSGAIEGKETNKPINGVPTPINSTAVLINVCLCYHRHNTRVGKQSVCVSLHELSTWHSSFVCSTCRLQYMLPSCNERDTFVPIGPFLCAGLRLDQLGAETLALLCTSDKMKYVIHQNIYLCPVVPLCSLAGTTLMFVVGTLGMATRVLCCCCRCRLSYFPLNFGSLLMQPYCVSICTRSIWWVLF